MVEYQEIKQCLFINKLTVLLYIIRQTKTSITMLNLINADALTNHLLRPPKFTYSITDLGSCIFDHNNILYQRIDFNVLNPDNFKIQASMWRKKHVPPQLKQKKKDENKSRENDFMKLNQKSNKSKFYSDRIDNRSNLMGKNESVMIYLHCNCGSRVQAMQLVYRALELGYVFVAYDSRGCGHSQGDYISLGYHQIWDLDAVISHLHEHYISNPNIVLWGRSMGAVTVMNYLIGSTRYIKNIKVAVLDSPFLNLNEVICQIVNKKIGIPKLLVDMFLGYIQPLVQQKVGFKISEFDLRGQISKIVCPLILMASKSDGLVPFKHLQQIYDAHHGRKSIFYLNQSHTDQRSTQTVSKIFKAITRYFLTDKKQILEEPITKSPKVNSNFKPDLLSCRSSQFVNPSTAKKSCSKKIQLTYPYSSSKSETFYTQLSIEKSSSLMTEQKKKKLSLNHSKSVKQQKNNPPSSIRTAIHLYSQEDHDCKQKIMNKLGKCDKKQVKHTAVLFANRLGQDDVSHRRIVSNFYKDSIMNKENACQRRLTQFQQLKNYNKN